MSKRNSLALNQLIDENELAPESVALKAAKYMLIELAEGMSNVIQQILAKEKGVATSGYIDAINKAHLHGMVSDALFQRLKPFFDFRNSLIHRYWTIDDPQLIGNIVAGRQDFEQFVQEIDAYITKT